MENKIKFQIEFVSYEKNILSLRSISTEEIVVKTLRLHNTSINKVAPEDAIFRSDKFIGVFEFSIRMDGDYAQGVTFVVKDETHKEQYSIGINFSTKAINIKEMMYGA